MEKPTCKYAQYLNRLIEYYQAVGIPHLIVGGVPWVVYHRMVVPRGPICHDFSISTDQQRHLLSHFKQAVLVRYTDGFHPDAKDSPWYAVTCNKFVDLDHCKSKLRHHIRKGLKRCVVRQVDAEYMADRGYDVYAAAFTRYINTKGPGMSRATWERLTRLDRDYPDLRHYWAVFVDNRLAAYTRTLNFGRTEVSYDTSKFDPKYLGDYSSYALNFTAGQYYLVEQSVEYVNTGFRTISHDTNIQNFRIQNFGFQRTPTNLYVRYRPWAAAALSMPHFARRWLARRFPKYASLCLLNEARTRARS